MIATRMSLWRRIAMTNSTVLAVSREGGHVLVQIF
jgi:hypothetical protein